mgnify:CR=1 FL=1
MTKMRPKSWIEIRLDTFLDIERGGSPRPIKSFLTDEPSGINWIKIGDTQNITKYIRQTREKIRLEGLKKSRLVVEGDFILSNSMSFGKPYIMQTTGAIHDGWLVLRPKNIDCFEMDYLYYILSSPNVFKQFDKLAAGSTVKNLNIGLVSSVVISFPPLNEQKRIVAKIEELFSELDHGIESLKKAKEQLKRYRQAVLKRAFDNISDSSTLENLISYKLTNGYSGNPVKYRTENKVLSLSATTLGVFDGSQYKFLDEKGLKERDIWCEPNDIFIQRGNTAEYVGVPAIYTGQSKAFIFPDLMIRVKADTNKVTPKFLNFALSSPQIRNYLRINAQGSAGTMPKINQKILYSLKIPFCGKEEQKSIVLFIETQFSVIDQLETDIDTNLKKAEILRQSILKKAFSGQLVPQDPNDEPASELLEKIKAEKAKQKSNKKQKKEVKV